VRARERKANVVKLGTLVVVIGACALLSAKGSAQDAPAPSAETGAAAPAAESSASLPPPSYAAAPVTPSGGIRDSSDHRRPFALSAMAYVPWWYGLGIGVKLGFEIPILHDGFIPSLNDSFSLEPSFSFAYSTWNRFSYYDDLHALRYTPALAALRSF
jgi:hypothetical protein